MIRAFILSIFFFCLSVGWGLAQTSGAAAGIEQRSQDFQAKFGVRLIYKNVAYVNDDIQFNLAGEAQHGLLADYLTSLEEEFSKYPPDFFKNHDIYAIALVMHLFHKGRPAQGIYGAKNAIMFFDFARFSENKSLKKHSIHHELFHMMATQTPNYVINDPAWNELNFPGFTYGDYKPLPGQKNLLNPQAPFLPGFVTDYAMTSIEEDKAEIFACLMQAQHRKIINRWAENDKLLAAKIQAIKDFVATYEPRMNEEYWSRIVPH